MHDSQQLWKMLESLGPLEKELAAERITELRTGNSHEQGFSMAECPYCGSLLRVKHGHQGGLQRYRCKSCSRTYTNATGTYLDGIHKKEKLEKFKQLMFTEYLPLEAMCSRIGIAMQTAFDWRHKLLCGIKEVYHIFRGSAELDHVDLAFSEKGRRGLDRKEKRVRGKKLGEADQKVRVLLTVDSSSHHDLSVARIGQLKRSDIERKLGGRFDADCTVVPGPDRSLVSFARGVNSKLGKPGLKPQPGSSQAKQTGEDLLELVNKRFRGVATKYLQSYANWLEFLKKKPPGRQEPVTIPQNRRAWNIHANIERIYRHFIEKQSPLRYECPTRRERKTAGVSAQLFNGKVYI